jgi:hypothetical protein
MPEFPVSLHVACDETAPAAEPAIGAGEGLEIGADTCMLGVEACRMPNLPLFQEILRGDLSDCYETT